MLAWQDALHEGPLACVPPAELRSLRAGFLADCGWGSAQAIAEDMRRRDELLAHALADGHPVVLWFEHDLYDQLQLLQILAAVPAETAGSVELIQANEHLGALDGEALAALWPSRVPVTPDLRVLGHRGWHAVCSGEIEPFLAGENVSALPPLAPALRRLLEEREPVGRTDRQLLESLAAGPATPLELFFANQAREEAVFLGDTWCFLHLYELAERGLVDPVAGGVLPLPPPRSDREAFTAVQLELTPGGRAREQRCDGGERWRRPGRPGPVRLGVSCVEVASDLADQAADAGDLLVGGRGLGAGPVVDVDGGAQPFPVAQQVVEVGVEVGQVGGVGAEVVAAHAAEPDRGRRGRRP